MALTSKHAIALLFAFLCLPPAAAAGRAHGSVPCPPQAMAAGFTTPVFYDDFHDLSKIDFGNTLAPGFNWYVKGPTPNFAGVDPSQTQSQVGNQDPLITSSAIRTSVEGGYYGKVGFDPVGNPGFLMSAAYKSGSSVNGVSNIVGNNWGGGGYFEARFRINGPPSFGSNAFFMIPSEAWTNNAQSYLEIDQMETSGSTTNNSGVYQVDSSACCGQACPNPGSVCSGPLNQNPSDNVGFHTYGVLWKTKAQNGGTSGALTYYTDNVQTLALTYTTNGNKSVGNDVKADSDLHHYQLHLKGDISDWRFVRVCR